MPNKKYRVELTDEQRSHLLERLGRGERPAAEQTRVRVLLKVDEGPEGPAWTDARTAEIENSAMARQCLSRRIPEKKIMENETSAWSTRRNEEGAAANGRFRTEDARIKLRRLYPNIDG